MAKRISTRLNPDELRRFGLTLAVPVALLAAVGAWRGRTFVPALLAGAALALTVCAIVAPRLLRSAHAVWMGFATRLGWLNTRLLLALAYFLIVTPTRIVMVFARHDPLDRRLRDRPSYWIQRPPHANPRQSMERHF